MATDRLTLTHQVRQGNASQIMCITCNIVITCGEGASEASGTLAMTAFSADYQSADYVQWASTPYGGSPCRLVYVILLRNLCQKSRHLSTIEHKLEQSFIG